MTGCRLQPALAGHLEAAVPHERKFEITDARRGAALTIRVVTQARQTEFAGVHDDGVIKVRLIASRAGEAAANEELLGFLADRIGVPVGQLAVVAGERERDKIVSIEGMTSGAVEEALLRAGL